MKSQIKIGILLQYAQMIISAIISLIYTPIMIDTLGKSEYGIYNLSASFVSYLSLLSLGLSGSYLRFYSRYKAGNQEKEIEKLNGMFLLTFFILAIVCSIIGISFSSNYILTLIFDTGLSSSELDLARVLMIILTFNISFTLIDSVFVSYVSSQEKFIFQKGVNVIRTVLSPFLTIPLLLFGFGSIAIAIVTTSLSILVTIIDIVYCLVKLKMRFKFREYDKNLFKEIFSFSFFIAVNQIIDQINWQTGKIIIGRFNGSEEVAVYSTASTINTLYLNLSTAISSVFAPRVNRIIATKDGNYMNDINSLFIKVGRIQFLFLGLILTGFIFFGQYFMSVWAGEGFENSYFVALLLICPVTIALIQNLGIEIQRAMNKHQFRSVVYFFMAIINVVISIFFVQLWGAIGAALGTCISLIIANGIVMNIYYKSKMGIDILQFWLNIGKMLLGLILPVIFGILVLIFVDITSLRLFFVLIIAYTIIYCASVFFLSMNSYERGLIKKPIKKAISLFRK